MDLNRREFLGAASTAAASTTAALPAMARQADDPLGVRRDFPVTDRGIYLDSAYITPSPRPATDAGRAFVEAKATGPIPLGAMLAKKEEVREQFARLVNASTDEIGFLSATSDGENVFANALDLKPGDNVVVDELHFTTSYILHRHLEQANGIELRVAKTEDGGVPPEAFERLVDDRTRLVSVAWVAHQNGFLHDMRALGELAHAHGAFLYSDAIQAAGMVPIDVAATPVDCFACGTYKWLLGGYGIAPFFVRRELLDRVPPDRLGFLQIERELDNYEYEFFKDARKYEYATPAFAAYYELAASLAYLESVGVDRVYAHSVGLAHRLCGGLVGLGLHPVTPGGNDSCIVAFVNPVEQRAAARVFDGAGIRLTFREGGTRIRVAPALFNNEREVDRFLEVAQQLL